MSEEDWCNLQRTATFADLEKYMPAARAAAAKIAESCVNESNHLLYLDADCDDDSFLAVARLSKVGGTINIIRTEAPVPGSRIIVELPDTRDNDTPSESEPAGRA